MASADDPVPALGAEVCQQSCAEGLSADEVEAVIAFVRSGQQRPGFEQ